MTLRFAYDSSFQPPAPFIPVQVRAPESATRRNLGAMLDTGADICAVPSEVVQHLQLRRVDQVTVRGFSQALMEVPVFAIEIALEEQDTWIGQVISWPESYAILGRDIMSRWRTLLDGPGQIVTIE